MLKPLLIASSLLASTSVFATTYTFPATSDPSEAQEFGVGEFAAVNLNNATTLGAFDLTGSFSTDKKNVAPSNPFALYNLTTNSLVSTVFSVIDSKTNTYGFDFQNLAAGTYQLRINVPGGSNQNSLITGSYTLTAVTTPVPEPESLGLLMAGLGLLGMVFYRKKRQ